MFRYRSQRNSSSGEVGNNSLSRSLSVTDDNVFDTPPEAAEANAAAANPGEYFI